MISVYTYRRSRPAVDISVEHLPPYKGEEKTVFRFENVGSGDLTAPESNVYVSWEPSLSIRLDWGETTILAPGSKKSIQCRLPDPPKGPHTIEVEVIASGVRNPKKTFQVIRK
jgi:hypothetical protein